MDEKRELIRHALATIAYRGGKAVRGAPDSFATFKIDPASRTPSDILAHLGDLFDWALSLAQGAQAWHDSTPLPWPQEIGRFFAVLGRFEQGRARFGMPQIHRPLSPAWPCAFTSGMPRDLFSTTCAYTRARS